MEGLDENLLYYLVITVGTVAIVGFLLWGRRTSRPLPPGPWGLPFIGYLPFLGKRPEVTLHRLSQKYGNIIGVKFGAYFGVVLNDHTVIREAFSQPEFLERPVENLPFKFLGPNFKSFVILNGEPWIEDRRFSLHALRNLGMNKSTHVQNVQEEIGRFLEYLAKQKGGPVDCAAAFAPTVSNNIVSLVFGKVMDYDHPERKFLDQQLLEVGSVLNFTAFFLYMPWLTWILMTLRIITVERMVGALLKVHGFVCKELEEHKKTRDPDNPRDYMDYYLAELEANSFKYPLTAERLTANTQGLFGAGSNTVRTTLSWMMMALAEYTDVQERIRNEVWEVSGRDQLPRIEDRPKMHYTEAVVQELMRWKTIAPLGVMRRASKDTMLGGYFIPKHSFVMANLYAAHHDVKYWGDPENFRPERFLKDGRIDKHDAFMPFSVGRRACPGEGLAMLEIFLYTSAIVQKFKIQFPAGERSSLEGKSSLVHEPYYTRACFVPIQQGS